MSGSKHTSIDQRLAEEAAQWLIDLEDGTAELSRFTTWLEASPRHVEEFLLASALWQASDSLDNERRIDVAELIARARDNVQPLDSALPRSPRYVLSQRRSMRFLGSISAGFGVLAVAAVLWIGLGNRELQYSTAIGEQRSFKLPDDSVVTLNTRSRISVRFAKTERVVELAEGEALFAVEHDNDRPFRVLAGGAVVQAVGTQFNVRHLPSNTTVSVVEGIVEVSSFDPSRTESDGALPVGPSERLSAGEQAQVSHAGELLRTPSAEMERVMAWRERRLIFRDEPLADIAAEFNRYNDTQLTVEGDATRARRMTGVFDADDPGALIAFLGRDPDLSVKPREGGIVIRGP